jgi:hypothetical protein
MKDLLMIENTYRRNALLLYAAGSGRRAAHNAVESQTPCVDTCQCVTAGACHYRLCRSLSHNCWPLHPEAEAEHDDLAALQFVVEAR